MGIIFDFFKKRKRLHLRHVVQVAVLIEQEGEQFYRQLAQASADTKVKKICDKLSLDEAVHKKLFENMLSRWASLPTDEEYLNSYIEKLKKDGLFSGPLPLPANEDKYLKRALEYENITVNFYLSLEKKFPELWKQAHIHQLVIEERQHADNLKSLILHNEAAVP